MDAAEKQRGKKPEDARRLVFVALDDVRSAHNVGSIFRTADGAGAAGVYLIGTTPAPVDRFGRSQPDIAKTALGAEQSMLWEYFETTEEFLKEMREKGVQIIVVEQDERAVDYKSPDAVGVGACVLVFGNEVGGVSRFARDAADLIISIPMHGKKESLNVAVAAGIVLYQLLS